MAFVHRQSCEGVKTELDLFTVPPTQNCISDSHVVEHQPTASLDSGGPVEFLIPGSGDDYLDLANTMLHVQAKITRADGHDLDADETVGPVNNWLHSMYSQIDLYLNGTLVTSSSNTYAYRAYIETLLSYGPEAKSTQLTNQLWCKDTSDRMDAVQLAAGAAPNRGFVSRRRHTSRSRMVDMMGRLHVDMFMQDKFLINGVDVKLRLVRSKPSFALMALGNTEYKIIIVNASLFVKKATLNPAVQMAHIAHAREPVPLQPAETSRTVLHRQRRLQRCVRQEPVLRQKQLHKLPLGVRGRPSDTRQTLPAQLRRKPLRQELREPVHLDRFKMWQDEGNGLPRDDYRDGYTFFCFDLTPDQCDGPCFHLVQKGNLRI